MSSAGNRPDVRPESFASEVPASSAPAAQPEAAAQPQAPKQPNKVQASQKSEPAAEPKKIEQAEPKVEKAQGLPPIPKHLDIPVMRIRKPASAGGRVVLINCTDYNPEIHEAASEADEAAGEKALRLKTIENDKAEQNAMFKRLVRGQ